MSIKHKWSEKDDIVACYLYRFGNDPIYSIKEIGEILGMGGGSLRMRVQNFQAIESNNSLRHYVKQTVGVYNKYKNIAKDDFLVIVREILNKSH